MNQSDLTRKGQVLAYLRERRNQWVNGPDLATEAVGGSEGLRRLRELRLSGEHDIRERRHPDTQRDIWQYMLVAVPAPIDLSDAFDDAKPNYPDPAVEAARRAEEARLDPPAPEPAPSPWPADHDQTRMTSAVRRKEDGTFEYVPPQRPLVEQLTIPADPPQPPGSRFDSMPAKVVWGAVAICPRCRSKTTRGRTPKEKEKDASVPEHVQQRKRKSKDEGPALVDVDGVLLFRDPHSRKARPCERCNGYGIVPNQGPIALTPPTAPAPSAAAADPETEEAFPDGE